MKFRYMGAAAVVALLVVVASTVAGGASGAQSAKRATLTVWLQEDAKSGWPEVVALATKAFKAKHPDSDVDVQYQKWTEHLTKFDATLAGGNAPDVIEMGNTEMTKYMAAGAFADITADKSKFPNSATWLTGLLGSTTYNGKLYGVPYYAGSRVVIYRTDYFRKAGVAGAPKSLAQFMASGKKLMNANSSDKSFSAFYLAGRDWYSAISFVYDYGGRIAKQSGGKWQGVLNSPQAIRGLTKAKEIFQALSRASATTDEAHPFPTEPFADGHAASFIGPGWQFGYALDKKAGNPKLKPFMAAYPMPGHIPGTTLPAFLGGSDLAIPESSQNQDLAKDWIAAYTSTAAMRGIVKAGNIPNTTSLLRLVRGVPGAQLATAAKRTWFVPTAKNWTNVESQNVLQNMLTSIYTNKQTVAQAATKASSQITSILNG
jgi:N,N'-diacetylchitobiose transport system substrate-binding protein